MKKALMLAMTLAALLSLTGCNDANKVYIAKNASLPTAQPVYQNDPLGNFVVEVDVNQVKALITSKESFALYIGNASCSSCEAFRPALLQYIYKSKSLIYHFDNLLHGTTYDELPTAYPDYFDDNYPPTPSLYFFKDGTLAARRNGSTRMFDYVTFEPIMSGYVKVTSINYIFSKTTLDQLIEESNSTIYFYSREDEASNNLYYNYLFPYVKGLSSKFYVMDVDSLNLSVDDELSFKTTYGLAAVTGEIANYHSGLVNSSILLGSGNEQAMVEWLKAIY
ncbi:MAG: hypothetical protein NTV44_03920 [Firmicutes bacterium]|nr:hypothetical protein [Bacillota bacterium]